MIVIILNSLIELNCLVILFCSNSILYEFSSQNGMFVSNKHNTENYRP